LYHLVSTSECYRLPIMHFLISAHTNSDGFICEWQ
jgi:hypothetical protein